MRSLADPFQHFDPGAANVMEGGGRYGPKLAADFGGERLRFMPVGGYDRDIPSDTDSDERVDFHLDAPEDKTHKTAMSLMDIPLTSERWEKEKDAERTLQDRFA